MTADPGPMGWHVPLDGFAGIVPRTPARDLRNALVFCNAVGDRGEPGRHAFTGKQQAPEHPCQIEAEVFDWCSRQPGGGLTYCSVCGSPVFVPPLTCLERVEEPDEEIDGAVIDAHDAG